MYGMLRRAPTNLQPLLTLKSSSSFDSNKRYCKSLPTSRYDLLLEPTSVLDIRSPSPSSTLSSSLGGSCDAWLGSTEKGSVEVSTLLPKDGGQLRSCTNLIDIGDGSVWKDSKNNGETVVEEEHEITQAASPWSGDIEMGNLNSCWVDRSVTGLVDADSNDEGSSNGMTDLIARNVVVASSKTHSSIVDGRQDHTHTIIGLDTKGNSHNFAEKIQAFAFPCNNCEGVSLSTTVLNMNGPNNEGRLKDVKREVIPFPPQDVTLDMENTQVREGEMSSVVQSNKVTTTDLNFVVRATYESILKGDQVLPRCDELLADLQILPGNEFQVGDSENASSIGMDDLERVLLQPPSPAPDQSLMKWLLGEIEDPVHTKGSLGAMVQLKEGANGQHQLDIQEVLDEQFSAGVFDTNAAETLPVVATTLTDSLFPIVASAAPSIPVLSSTNLSPPSLTFPASILPHIPPNLPGSTMLSTVVPPSRSVHVNLHPQLSLPSIDASATTIQSVPDLQSQSRLVRVGSRPVTYQSSLTDNLSSGYPPVETKMPQSPMFASLGPFLSNNSNPTCSVAEEYTKLRKVMDDRFSVPFQSSPLLEPMSPALPSSSAGISCPQEEFKHHNRFHCPRDTELLQNQTRWQANMEPGCQALTKSTNDPSRVNQEVLIKSQQGHDGLVSLQRRYIQFPEPRRFSQCVQGEKLGVEEVQLAMVDQLLKAAEAVEHGKISMAEAILARLNQHLSPQGKPLQRTAFYFKEALAKQIVGSDGAFPTVKKSSLDILHKISAIKSFCEFSPVPQFAHFTANQIILEEMQKEECIHLIDFQLDISGQWASFLQEVSLWPRGPPKLRITTVASESFEMELTRDLLCEFARSLNISLDFQLISVRRLECLSSHMFKIGEQEAIAVNFSFGFSRLLEGFSSTDSLIAFFQMIKRLSPKVVAVMDMESYCEGSSLIGQFIDSLQFYASLFDSLESTNVPMENILNIEKFIFAPRIATLVEGSRRNEKRPHWRGLLQGAGFSHVPLSFMAEKQAECLVRCLTTRGFSIVKKQWSLLLGWHGRALAAASAWRVNPEKFAC